ncbi:hypothetical protein M8J77_018150 [Diaphorina citri]|nr:hypothetical protein M8J77_018150 [Diaphorina citri]
MFQQSNNSNVDPQIEGTSHNRNHVMIGNKDLDTAAVVDDNKNNDFDTAVNDNDVFDNSPANVEAYTHPVSVRIPVSSDISFYDSVHVVNFYLFRRIPDDSYDHVCEPDRVIEKQARPVTRTKTGLVDCIFRFRLYLRDNTFTLCLYDYVHREWLNTVIPEAQNLAHLSRDGVLNSLLVTRNHVEPIQIKQLNRNVTKCDDLNGGY